MVGYFYPQLHRTTFGVQHDEVVEHNKMADSLSGCLTVSGVALAEATDIWPESAVGAAPVMLCLKLRYVQME